MKGVMQLYRLLQYHPVTCDRCERSNEILSHPWVTMSGQCNHHAYKVPKLDQLQVAAKGRVKKQIDLVKKKRATHEMQERLARIKVSSGL